MLIFNDFVFLIMGNSKPYLIFDHAAMLFSAFKYDVVPENEQFTILAIEDIVMYKVNAPSLFRVCCCTV